MADRKEDYENEIKGEIRYFDTDDRVIPEKTELITYKSDLNNGYDQIIKDLKTKNPGYGVIQKGEDIHVKPKKDQNS